VSGLPPVEGELADVLPAAAASLGVPVRPVPFELPAAPRICVLLVDGLGERQLAVRGGHAPYLRDLLRQGRVLSTSFPSSTATSMGSFGTGLPPGAHGLVGYQVRDPETGVLLNELMWDPAVDPRAWQPEPTVLERLVAAEVAVTRIGPGFFDGSGLTEAALRGGRFIAARTLPERVEAALTALRADARALVYVYWGDLDKVGHTDGCESWSWGEELGSVDLAVRRLAAGMPSDGLLLVTADHGMVDVPPDARADLATDPELAAGVSVMGGEPRAPMLYCEPGAAPDVLATWRERLAGSMQVLSRAEAIAAGWFGPVSPRVLPRIGDVVSAALQPVSVHDSRTQRPELLKLIGMHGALTAEETRVPLLTVPGRRVG
jgi:hypothetical protein